MVCPISHIYDSGKIYLHSANSGHKLDSVPREMTKRPSVLSTRIKLCLRRFNNSLQERHRVWLGPNRPRAGGGGCSRITDFTCCGKRLQRKGAQLSRTLTPIGKHPDAFNTAHGRESESACVSCTDNALSAQSAAQPPMALSDPQAQREILGLTTHPSPPCARVLRGQSDEPPGNFAESGNDLRRSFYHSVFHRGYNAVSAKRLARSLRAKDGMAATRG